MQYNYFYSLFSLYLSHFLCPSCNHGHQSSPLTTYWSNFEIFILQSFFDSHVKWATTSFMDKIAFVATIQDFMLSCHSIDINITDSHSNILSGPRHIVYQTDENWLHKVTEIIFIGKRSPYFYTCYLLWLFASFLDRLHAWFPKSCIPKESPTNVLYMESL